MHDLAAIARECVEEVNELKVPTDVVLAVVARLAVASATFVTVTMPSFLEPLAPSRAELNLQGPHNVMVRPTSDKGW
jgi:hypothetical protein